MSICSKYNDEERKQLDKTQYMRMASYDDILQLIRKMMKKPQL